MKKIGRFICFTTLFLLIAGCKQQKTIRYELVDGNPQIDYIDFFERHAMPIYRTRTIGSNKPLHKKRRYLYNTNQRYSKRTAI